MAPLLGRGRAAPLALALGLLLPALAAAMGSPTFSLVGRSTHMRLTSGNSSVDVRVGRVFEASSSGQRVEGHALPSLASLRPSVTNGTTQLNGTAVSFATLSVGGLPSILGFAAACPGGCAPLPSAVPLAAATLNVTVYWGAPADVLVPYGNGSVALPAGGVKFNIDAAGWPFCSSSNQLMVELTIHTSEASDQPVLFDAAATDGSAAGSGAVSGTASTATTPVPAATRRLLDRPLSGRTPPAGGDAAAGMQPQGNAAGWAQNEHSVRPSTDGSSSGHDAGRPGGNHTDGVQRPDASRPPPFELEGQDGGGAGGGGGRAAAAGASVGGGAAAG